MSVVNRLWGAPRVHEELFKRRIGVSHRDGSGDIIVIAQRPLRWEGARSQKEAKRCRYRSFSFQLLFDNSFHNSCAGREKSSPDAYNHIESQFLLGRVQPGNPRSIQRAA